MEMIVFLLNENDRLLSNRNNRLSSNQNDRLLSNGKDICLSDERLYYYSQSVDLIFF